MPGIQGCPERPWVNFTLVISKYTEGVAVVNLHCGGCGGSFGTWNISSGGFLPGGPILEEVARDGGPTEFSRLPWSLGPKGRRARWGAELKEEAALRGRQIRGPRYERRQVHFELRGDSYAYRFFCRCPALRGRTREVVRLTSRLLRDANAAGPDARLAI